MVYMYFHIADVQLLNNYFLQFDMQSYLQL